MIHKKNNIIYTGEARDYFIKLVQVLLEENYFADRTFALKYVDELREKIETSILIMRPKVPYKRRPCYGKDTMYISVRKNRNTSYIIFFTQKDNIYLVEYIGNNHTDGHYLIEQ